MLEDSGIKSENWTELLWEDGCGIMKMLDIESKKTDKLNVLCIT